MSDPVKTNNKVFAVAMVLVVPVMLFLLFYLYTKPTKDDMGIIDLPHRMFAMGVDTILEDGNYVVDTVYHKIPDFAFQNQYGQTITQETVAGKIFITDFFFTKCPSICPKMTEQLVRVQNEFIRDDRVVILSHTVDPQRDSVATLKKYADKYDAMPGKWHFLTGDKETIYEQAKIGYYLSAVDESVEIDDDFVHTERFVLVDPNGNIRGYYYGTDERDVNRLMGDVVLVLKEFSRDD